MRKTLFKKNTHSNPRRSPDYSTPDSLENQESADLDLSVFIYILLGFFALLGAYNLIF